jgi:hypothetical protein
MNSIFNTGATTIQKSGYVGVFFWGGGFYPDGVTNLVVLVFGKLVDILHVQGDGEQHLLQFFGVA